MSVDISQQEDRVQTVRRNEPFATADSSPQWTPQDNSPPWTFQITCCGKISSVNFPAVKCSAASYLPRRNSHRNCPAVHGEISAVANCPVWRIVRRGELSQRQTDNSQRDNLMCLKYGSQTLPSGFRSSSIYFRGKMAHSKIFRGGRQYLFSHVLLDQSHKLQPWKSQRDGSRTHVLLLSHIDPKCI